MWFALGSDASLVVGVVTVRVVTYSDGDQAREATVGIPVVMLAQLGQHDRAISYGPGHTLRSRAAQSLSQAVKNDSPSPECTRGL